ncbi:hypothetical protein Btru_042320 [Bulinus truncatus]|nr:hypothetical protein Btru_042320 [Bulinus truncatus]
MATKVVSFYISSLLIFYLVKLAIGGQTCTFTQSSTNIAIYCENGCCSNQCCTSSSVNTDAIAIGVSVVLAILILILLIALLIYCCHKRNKRKTKSDLESTTTENTDDMVLHHLPHKKTGLTRVIYFDNTKHVQTGEPAPPYKEKVLFGRSNRWSSFVPGHKNQHKVHPLRPYNTVEKVTQTKGNQPMMIRPVLPGTPPYDPESSTMTYTETVKIIRGPPVKEKPKNSWTPQVPWQPHAGEKSLSKTRPKPLDTYANYGSRSVDQHYPTHRHSPEPGHYRYNDSDYLEDKLSSRSSAIAPRPSTLGDS